ncbi:hypothetical protein [Bathymodiolus platifrons methanotrophic gill symbiont]|uniref:hypothetical protein n=1 Tax=Bathymodiolus platifrons methanotrophic gill symbiont TaxID=113268 RepID=UPI000B41C79C|nr:hypothetical protein [Bathymodiolus platifrons methanotrophic gill symbiont]
MLQSYKQARHATSRNLGTPITVIRSPTQRIGDAPAALRPPQTVSTKQLSHGYHKWLYGFRDKILASLAHFGLANFPAPFGDYHPVWG